MRQATQIRRATASDVEALSNLIDRTLVASNAPDYETRFIDMMRESMSATQLAARLAERDCFVAIDSGEIVGTASWSGGRLRQMYVAPEHQRNGLGRQLVRHIEAHARSQGAAKIELSSSHTARGFYEKLGYQMICYQSDGVPTWLMRKSL
jgi:GNAT superfamily N-acetyltransferase